MCVWSDITAVQDYEMYYMNAWLKRCVFNLDLNRESVSEPWTLSGRLFQSLGDKYETHDTHNRTLTTASKTFVCQKKFGSGSIFCIFTSVACILIGKDGEYEKMEKRMRKFRTQCAMALTWAEFVTVWWTANHLFSPTKSISKPSNLS